MPGIQDTVNISKANFDAPSYKKVLTKANKCSIIKIAIFGSLHFWKNALITEFCLFFCKQNFFTIYSEHLFGLN